MTCLLKGRCVVACEKPLLLSLRQMLITPSFPRDHRKHFWSHGNDGNMLFHKLSATLLTLSITLSITLLNTTATAEINAAITINSEWGYSTEANNTEKLETTIKPEIEIDLSHHIKLTAIGRVRGDVENRIDSNNSTDRELREFYIETSIGRSFLTLGKQQIVWGKADGLKVLDVVNPQSWREFILDDFDNSRIPLWAINSEIPIADLTLQLLWLPDQRYHEYALGNDYYAFTSPLLVPQSPPGVNVSMQAAQRPDRRIQDADWGARLSIFWNGWDLTLNYLYHYDDRPVLFRQLSTTPNGSLATITPRYQRSHLIGSSFSNSFGDLTLRGEIGYASDRYISTNSISDQDGVVNSNEFSYVIGLDWFGFSDTFISTQLFQSHLNNDQLDMLRDRRDTTLTLLFRRDFNNETLTAELLWLHNLGLDDGLARPKITYQMNDNTTLWLGVDIFYGNKQGLFGQFKKRDRMVSAVEIAF